MSAEQTCIECGRAVLTCGACGAGAEGWQALLVLDGREHVICPQCVTNIGANIKAPKGQRRTMAILSRLNAAANKAEKERAA